MSSARRSLLTAAALAAVLPVPTQAAVSRAQALRERLSAARAAIDRHLALYVEPENDEEYYRHFNEASAVVEEIEHLSIDSLEALKAKVEAADWCNETLMKPGADSTDFRLLCQILRAIQAV